MSTCSSCGQELQAEAKFCPGCGTRVVASGSSADPLIGRTLNGKYRLTELIGAGSMGTVYLGEHIGLQKKVALKVLRPDLEVSEETLQRFQREGIAAGKFSHTNAIQIFDFDRAEERLFYLAMEFVEGSNLKEHVAEHGRLSPAEAVEVVRQILGALSEAHQHGIVHRDLKPENIMVVRGADEKLAVKVLDFGLSKLIHFPLGASLQTQPGRIMGTPLYMAPEQGLGDEVDSRSDLYAVGLILYELLSGALPFHAETLTELITKQVTEPAPSLAESHPDLSISGALEGVVARALEKLKADRFQSAAEMLDALEAADLGGPRAGALRAPVRRAAGPSKAAAQAPARPSGPEPARPASGARLARFAGLAVVLLVLGGAAWRFGLGESGSAAAALPRVSLKAAELRTEEEARYVRLLDESRGDLREGDLDVALSRVEEALDLPCRDSEAFLVRAGIYAARGDADTALADYREALRLDPGYAAAAAGAGWVELDRGRPEPARERFEEAARLDPDSAAAAAGRGAVLHLLGERDEARELLERAVDLDPDGPRAPLYLGRLLLEEEELDAAVEALVRAKRNAPRSWEAHAELGRAYLASGRADDAEKQLREAVDLEPGALAPALALGSLLIDAERYDGAIELLREPVRRNPDAARPRVLLAAALEAVGRDAEAIDELERAVEIDGGDPRVRTLLGTLHQQAGSLRRAIEEYDAALAVDSFRPLAHLNRGLALFALEEFELAAEALRSAVEIDPRNAFAHYGLGILHMDYVGGAERAIEHFETYVRLGGTDERVAGWIRRLGG